MGLLMWVQCQGRPGEDIICQGTGGGTVSHPMWVLWATHCGYWEPHDVGTENPLMWVLHGSHLMWVLRATWCGCWEPPDVGTVSPLRWVLGTTWCGYWEPPDVGTMSPLMWVLQPSHLMWVLGTIWCGYCEPPDVGGYWEPPDVSTSSPMVWVLGTELGSSAGEVHSLNCWAGASATSCMVLKRKD